MLSGACLATHSMLCSHLKGSSAPRIVTFSRSSRHHLPGDLEGFQACTVPRVIRNSVERSAGKELKMRASVLT